MTDQTMEPVTQQQEAEQNRRILLKSNKGRDWLNITAIKRKS